MNKKLIKKLIKKYKKEFDHWINGGELLAKNIDCADSWHPFQYWNHNDWNIEPEKVAIIINDEYTEFRKALAEGKKIHIASDEIQSYYLNGIPGYLTTDCDFTLTVDKYTVKLEEPKFKVGDWVRIAIDNNIYQLTDEDMCDNLDKELWKPQPGELVILKDKYGTITIINYNGEAGIVPFIGEKTWLPKKD